MKKAIVLILSISAFIQAQQNLSSLYYRGELNGWGATSMIYRPLGTASWLVTVQSTANDVSSEFKFDRDGDWDPNWGTGGNVSFASVSIVYSNGANGNISVTQNKYYSFLFKDVLSGNSECVVFETTNQPVSILNVSDNFSGAGNAVNVSIEISSNLSLEENIYLRYTTDNWASSSFVLALGSGTNYSATIPSNDVTGTDANEYYVLTTTGTPDHSTADLLTLNYNTNNGNNFPLPVELSSFTATIIGNEINLNWKTATEVNNYGFNVERRTKSEEWNTIGFVNGSGNSNSPKEYSYKDKTAAAGNYTYRLKQIDNDGQFKYSPEVEVAVNNIIDGYILEQNYPNPFNPATSIKFGFNNDTEVNLLVFDQIGNQVATLFSGKAEAGRIYNVEFNAEGLSSGIYFYRLETPLKSEVRKMLLMK
ncbi:MAG: T9SS C-terminal target domain-containing protein [Ignavibacteriales bacterium]|nr:MAG: T9SS C-terminal target domain-containing protein [Ignavibacteriales bacterium]